MKGRGVVFLGLGFEMVGLILAAVYIGQYLDKQWQWPGYATMVTVILALVGWFHRMLVLLKRMDRENDQSGKPPT